jgi:hypothetical protein
MNTENIRRLLRKFDEEHPLLHNPKKKRRGMSEGSADDSMATTADGEMDDNELAAFHEEALEILQGPDDIQGNTSPLTLGSS